MATSTTSLTTINVFPTEALYNANKGSIGSSEISLVKDTGSYIDTNIAYHNLYPRCKFLGSTVTTAQNEAIKNRTYNDLFIGDYWTINDINWRIVAIDYYYRIGDTDFTRGNIIIVPDTCLYSSVMNSTNTTSGAYNGSAMRASGLNNARTMFVNAFGDRLASHRVIRSNSADAGWAWYDSNGVELMSETQVYGTKAWSTRGFDVGTNKMQFPLFAVAHQFVNTRQTYWLQDVSSYSPSAGFARVYYYGHASSDGASYSDGVRPAFTLTYI